MTLRELVAVEVMGAKVIGTLDPVPDGFYVRNGAVCYGNDAEKRCCFFRPDTDIADAWRVVEKMQMFAAGSFERERFEYAFAGLRLDTASSQQAASAICIIALRACGVSEDRIEQARRKV